MRTAWLPQTDGEWGAVFSDCDRYRYRLWRAWDEKRPTLAFCMLNPSTATEIKNDPTIERCMRRAISWGYGRLEIVNIFALRSTDPRALYATADPVGPGNTEALAQVANDCTMLICAWGKHGAHLRVGNTVKVWMQRAYPKKLRVLGINNDGSPRHPLYIGYDVRPERWV